MRYSFSLGTLLGIEIRANFTWLVGLSLLIWLLNSQYFPSTYPGWTGGAVFSAAITTALFFFLSVLGHELGHSLVSAHLGMPVKSIDLFIFGGQAQLNREPDRPRDEFIIALAGPLVSLFLGFAFQLLSWAGPERVSVPVAAISAWLGYVNLGLGVFNLLPGLPLDGGRILRAMVWAHTHSYRKATTIAVQTGRILAFGLIAWGIWTAFKGSWTNGLWVVLVGWFIKQSATQDEARVILRDILAGHKVREAMMTDCPQVGPSITLQKLVDDVAQNSKRHCFPVFSGGRIVGLITISEIQRIAQAEWPMISVGSAMTPFKELKFVSPDSELFEVFKQMASLNVNQLPVVENSQFVGMIAQDSVIDFLENHPMPG